MAGRTEQQTGAMEGVRAGEKPTHIFGMISRGEGGSCVTTGTLAPGRQRKGSESSCASCLEQTLRQVGLQGTKRQIDLPRWGLSLSRAVPWDACVSEQAESGD